MKKDVYQQAQKITNILTRFQKELEALNKKHKQELEKLVKEIEEKKIQQIKKKFA